MEDWIQNIEEGHKVMLSMYKDIQQIQDRAKAQFLEVNKYYSTTSMEISSNDSRDELESLEVMVQQFRASFQGVRDDIYIHKIFRME